MPANDERLNRFERELGELEHQVESLRRKEVEVDVRLNNGREVMKDLKGDLEKLRPKAHNLIRLAGIAGSIVLTALAGQNWLQNKLDERPKQVEVERLLREHAEHGQDSMTNEINSLRQALATYEAELKLVQQRLESLERGHDLGRGLGKRLDVIREGLTNPK